MGLIDRVDAKLPENLANARTGTIKKTVVYSGHALDGRTLSIDDVKEYYYNTKKAFLENGIPVHILVNSHFAEGKLNGWVKSMELVEQNSDAGRGVEIICALSLQPELYQSYIEGYYSGFSIGAALGGVDRNGNDIGPVIEHVAILGEERQALAELNKGKSLRNFMNKKKFKIALSNLLGSIGVKLNREVLKQMDDSQMQDVIAMIQTAIKALQQVEGVLGGEPSEEMEERAEMEEDKGMKKDDEEQKSVALTDSEIGKAFKALSNSGHVMLDDIDDFYEKSRKTNDLELVKSLYMNRDKRVPESGTETGSDYLELDNPIHKQIKAMSKTKSELRQRMALLKGEKMGLGVN